jgi:DNA-binding Xre family transcriptional regulator
MKKLTEVERKSMENLRGIWSAYKAEHKTTQEEIVESVGKTQSWFSIYLSGHAAIGLNTAITLAEMLDCNVSDILEQVKNRK